MDITCTQVVVVEALGRIRAVFYSESEADDFIASNNMYMSAPDLKLTRTKLLETDASVPEFTLLGSDD